MSQMILIILYFYGADWRGAERRWLDLGEVWPAHDAPHTGVTRVASCADCAGMYAYDIFCRHDMPVGILQIIKEAHKVFSTPCRS